jgi:colanic acid/amylovoran biosynthesis glycosyltransferase
MNLLFINSIFPQPSQTFVFDHVRYARSLGHAVTVFYKRFNRDLARQQAATLNLFDITIYDRPRSFATFLRLVKGLALRPSTLIRYLRHRGAYRLHFSDFICAVQVARVPDVMIANFGPNGIVAARIKRGFFPDATLAVVFHGFDVSSYVVRHGWTGYREAAAAIDLAISVNRQWARLLRENTAIKEIVVHHLGVDLDRIPSWRGHAAGAFAILFVGRMVEKKGLRFLLEAVVALKARGRDVHVHAVGDGPDHAALVAAAAAAGLGDAVTMHGAKPHDFVLSLMSECDCLALPSVTAADGDQEGIPVTLMEAMACGLPVVSTVHSGIPELVANEATGLLVPERDVPALADALDRLIADPGLGRGLAENARRFVAAEFNAEVQNRALFGLILGARQRAIRHGEPASPPVPGGERSAPGEG